MTHRLFASLTLALGLTMAASLIATTSAFANNNPIPGVDIVVKRVPPRGSVIQTKTDAKGNFTIGTLTPGDYSVNCLSWSWGTTNSGKVDPNPKGAFHVVLVEILVSSVQTPVVSSRQTVGPGQSFSVRFTVPDTAPGIRVVAGDVNGDGRTALPGGTAPAKPHQYIGTVTLLK